MDKYRLNIAIVEPSLIIYEGLSNILLQGSNAQYQISYFDSLEEIVPELLSEEIDLVIINPSQAKNDIKTFHQAKNNSKSAIWVGIVYSFFEKELLSLFDDIIQITDSPEIIIDTIKRLVSLNHQLNTKFCLKEQLSLRETEVLKQLVQGLSNKEIADQLNISIHTVISHRKNIVHKTGIKSQAGLTIYAISNKIIDIENYQE